MSILLLALLLSPASQVLADGATRPELAYRTAFGGSSDDAALATATDTEGNVYLTGYTGSYDFPVASAFQERLGGVPLRTTSDQGKNWSAPDIKPAVFSIAASPKQPELLFAGTAGGVYQSGDAGRTWTRLGPISL